VPLESDIVDRVRANFCDAQWEVAVDDLAASGKSGQIVRCIVFAAQGSLDRLRELIKAAELDTRSLITAGEYDNGTRKIRDLSVSFLIASPADFWITNTATSAHELGYRLTGLKSIPAFVGPFNDPSDRNEGEATFSNGKLEVRIQKRDRQWSILGMGPELRRYGLDMTTDDEERFRIQLVYYLSRR
jgi:hypothetical protein